MKLIRLENKYRVLFLIQLLLLYFPNLQIFAIETDNGTIPASLCYFFSLVFLPGLIFSLSRLKIPFLPFTGFVVYLALLAALRIPRYGLSKSILHWAFGFFLLLIIINVGRDLKREDWLWILQTAACIFAVTHFIFIVVFHLETVKWLLAGYRAGTIDGGYADRLPSLTRGGRNLDASWLSLGGFFVTGRKKAPYVTWSILFSFLGGSRVGMIAAVCVVVWSLVYDRMYRLRRNNLKWYALYGAVLLGVLLVSGLAWGMLGRFVDFKAQPSAAEESSVQAMEEQPSDTADESEETSTEFILSGRAGMWKTVPRMLRDNPWGYGVGNAMRVMKKEYGFTSYEDVVHNVFLQLLVDEGILGGIWFLATVGLFLWSQRKERFCDPCAAFLLSYLILSLVQFHGGEALMFFTLGIYMQQKRFFYELPWAKAEAG